MVNYPLFREKLILSNGGWEKRSLYLCLIIYCLWQFNAVLHHGAWGQDFGMHINWIDMAIKDPWHWLRYYDEGRTCPPLYHLLAAQVFKLTHRIHSVEVFALLTMILNALAIYGFYSVIQQLMHNRVMRLACFIFILYLPFAMIHAVVIAADSLVTPIFLSYLAIFARYLLSSGTTKFRGLLFANTLLLCFGLAIKFTFIVLVPTAVLAYYILYRTNYMPLKRFVVAALITLLLPGLFGYQELRDYRSQSPYNLGIAKVWPSPTNSPYMNLRSLLMVKPIDKMVLLAPSYNYSEDGKRFSLLEPNRYSYPALLHLALYTDISNFYQYDPDDGYFGVRDYKAQKAMRHAVRGGLIFSLAAIISLPLVFGMSLRAIWRRQKGFAVLGGLILLFSSAFYLNLVFFFPYIPSVYGAGYWLPRLVVPALLCFFILSFSLWDRYVVTRYRWTAWLCLVMVLWQSSIHLSFLWPWGCENCLRFGAQHFDTQPLR